MTHLVVGSASRRIGGLPAHRTQRPLPNCDNLLQELLPASAGGPHVPPFSREERGETPGTAIAGRPRRAPRVRSKRLCSAHGRSLRNSRGSRWTKGRIQGTGSRQVLQVPQVSHERRTQFRGSLPARPRTWAARRRTRASSRNATRPWKLQSCWSRSSMTCARP